MVMYVKVYIRNFKKVEKKIPLVFQIGTLTPDQGLYPEEPCHVLKHNFLL